MVLLVDACEIIFNSGPPPPPEVPSIVPPADDNVVGTVTIPLPVFSTVNGPIRCIMSAIPILT